MSSSPPNLQIPLEDELVRLEPLQAKDFEALFAVAADPFIWEQHPNRDRYQRAVFENFFKGALESGGAYLIFDQTSGELAGSTRLYDYNSETRTICIGYTFLGRKFWGTGLNPASKTLLINQAFTFADEVHFHIGGRNFRSQVAIGRLGAKKIAEKEISYYGEPPALNFIYSINRKDWKDFETVRS